MTWTVRPTIPADWAPNQTVEPGTAVFGDLEGVASVDPEVTDTIAVFRDNRAYKAGLTGVTDMIGFATLVESDAEAQAVFDGNGTARNLEPDTRLVVTVPFEEDMTAAELHEMLVRYRRLQAGSFGKIDLEIPDGYWELYGDSIEARANENEFSIKGSGTPSSYPITSIDYGTTVSGRVPVTIGVGTALPDRVVPGYAVGTQAIYGDEDAAAVTGALVVETVASDRLSLTATFWLRRNASAGDDPDLEGTYYQPVSPTTITTEFPPATEGGPPITSVNGVPISRLVIPRFCINFTGGWNGRTTEGAICAVDGGMVRTVNCGFSYNSNHTDAGCIGFIKHPNSYWYSERDTFAGGPEKVVRVPMDGTFRGQLSCYGGGGIGTHPEGGSNAEVINSQEGGRIFLVRCCVGGGKTHTVVAANDSYANVNQSFLSGGTSGVRTGNYGVANVLATRITHAQRGVYCVSGKLTINAVSSIENSYLDVGWNADGFVYGNPVRTGNYISTIPQRTTSGGGWFEILSRPLYDPGPRVSPASKDIDGNGGVMQATLSGAGWLELVGSNQNLMGIVRFTTNAGDATAEPPEEASTTATGLDLGSTLEVVTTKPEETGATDGKVTIGIYGEDYATYLRVVNMTGSSAVLRVYARGDVTLGDFEQIFPVPEE